MDLIMKKKNNKERQMVLKARADGSRKKYCKLFSRAKRKNFVT